MHLNVQPHIHEPNNYTYIQNDTLSPNHAHARLQRWDIKFGTFLYSDLKNWGRSCNNRSHARKKVKSLSARRHHALESIIHISSNQKYWSIGLENWILVYVYAFFIELIVFAKKNVKFRYWKKIQRDEHERAARLNFREMHSRWRVRVSENVFVTAFLETSIAPLARVHLAVFFTTETLWSSYFSKSSTIN